ncbi:MAG: hypothetical protein JHC72_06245 [Candidatus Nanopelagicus sp.]|nr:hypothetical protein [Candidatus Nanopelagicus sp.]
MKRNLLIAAITSSSLLLSSAHAASPTPKASPTAKATPVVSNSAKATPAVSSTTKKPTKKPVKKKKKVKKTATPIPSPSPVWPPIGFTANKGIYAKIPTSKELLGLISAKAGLAEVVKKCESNACGAVIVAADYRCEWWEIKSTVYGVDPNDASKKVTLGKLRTLYGPLSAQTYANIILVSDEPLYGPSVLDPNSGQTVAGPARNGISVGGISAICHKSGTDEKFPANIYTPIR